MIRKSGWMAWLALLVFLGYRAAEFAEDAGRWNDDAVLIAEHGSGTAISRSPAPETPESVDPPHGIRFTHSANTGIDRGYDHGATGEYHLAETLGGGLGALDYDEDGLTDIIVIDGGDPLNWPEQTTNRVGLFRQIGSEEFAICSDNAGISWSGYGHGCAVGDVDNDGFDDFFVTGYQSTGLFINQGDGTFRETTVEAGLQLDRWCATACFGDLDRDGDPDLYVTGYADVPRDLPTPYCDADGQRIHCHPHHYDAVPDYVFENLGDGTFLDRSESSGIASHVEYGLGVVMADLDQDLVPEIFVANDGDRNLLFRARGDWSYEEIGLQAGVAYESQGRSMGSMGIACADFDRNGLLDLITTNFADERNVLFSNRGDGAFYDESLGSSLDRTSRALVGWGAVPIDADLDGRLDLFIANGHVTEMPHAPYRQHTLFYRGSDEGRLVAVDLPGDYFQTAWHGRGAITAELTGDGKPDLVVSHIQDPVALLKNESPARGGSLSIRLVGVDSNRSGAGVRLELTAGSFQSVSEFQLSSGYMSSSTAKRTYGWPDADQPASVDIVWPSGQKQHVAEIRSGTELLLIEGREPVK